MVPPHDAAVNSTRRQTDIEKLNAEEITLKILIRAHRLWPNNLAEMRFPLSPSHTMRIYGNTGPKRPVIVLTPSSATSIDNPPFYCFCWALLPLRCDGQFHCESAECISADKKATIPSKARVHQWYNWMDMPDVNQWNMDQHQRRNDRNPHFLVIHKAHYRAGMWLKSVCLCSGPRDIRKGQQDGTVVQSDRVPDDVIINARKCP